MNIHPCAHFSEAPVVLVWIENDLSKFREAKSAISSFLLSATLFILLVVTGRTHNRRKRSCAATTAPRSSRSYLRFHDPGHGTAPDLCRCRLARLADSLP